MNPVTISFTLPALNASGVSLAQSLAAAANLTLNGAFVSTISSGTIATLSPARRLAVTSAGNDAALSWFIFGTDRWGNPQNETIAGVSSSSTNTVYDYLTITRISGSSQTAGNVSAGTTSIGSTAWYPREFNAMGGLSVFVSVGAGVKGTFEVTPDDVQAAQSNNLIPYATSVNPQSNIPPVAWAVTTLTTITTASSAYTELSHMYWRWTTYSGTTASVVQVVETFPYGQQGSF